MMKSPRVDPVGVVEVPAGYQATPRRYSARLRMLAASVLGIFLGVSVATTVASLASYCITSYAGWFQPPAP